MSRLGAAVIGLLEARMIGRTLRDSGEYNLSFLVIPPSSTAFLLPVPEEEDEEIDVSLGLSSPSTIILLLTLAVPVPRPVADLFRVVDIFLELDNVGRVRLDDVDVVVLEASLDIALVDTEDVRREEVVERERVD
jgi:hypothetical protein